MPFLRSNGLVLVLVALVALFSVLTWTPQPTLGRAGADVLADALDKSLPAGARVVIFAGQGPDDRAFADRARERLEASGREVVDVVVGQPFEGLDWLQARRQAGQPLDAIVVSTGAAGWTFLRDVADRFPNWPALRIYEPARTSFPSYLLPENLRNILSQIAVIALVAIGMTLVIATGGIDLSVGGLMAFAAVLTALLIRDFAGDESATPLGMTLCCLAAIAATASLGLVTGTLVTVCRFPPFIATLGIMWIARGLAFKTARGQSIRVAADGFAWLGRGSLLPGVPNVVVLVGSLYVLGYVLVNRTVLGRYILAVGSNARAALIAGVPIRTVLLFVYVASAALAGLGGIVLASQLQTGDPKFGSEYELYAITAVVVGGTSLRGGHGRMFGTLLGALLISVVQVGMNLIHIASYDQMMVLGGILLVSVFVDLQRPRSNDAR